MARRSLNIRKRDCFGRRAASQDTSSTRHDLLAALLAPNGGWFDSPPRPQRSAEDALKTWNGHPNAFPPVAKPAVASQPFPQPSPFRRWLPKYFPGHCRFGSRLPSVSPVIAVLAVVSQVFPRPLPFWRLLPNRFPGHRRFGGRLPSSSSVTAVLAVASETSPRLPPRRKAKSWPVKTCPSCSSSASTSRRNS